MKTDTKCESKPEFQPLTKPEVKPMENEKPMSPISPKASEKVAINEFVNEGNPATATPQTKPVSTKTVLEHLSNPKNV